MKLAFLTMVWRDYWLLERWIAHNEKTVRRAQLFVVNHGGDEQVDTIAAGCNIIRIPRDEIDVGFDQTRWEFLSELTRTLLKFYDIVICNDVDELICPAHPDGDLRDVLSTHGCRKDAIAPVGLNIMPDRAADANDNHTLLEQYPNALVNARFTKPCIALKPLEFNLGGHALIGGSFDVDPRLVLIHLHYVTPGYEERIASRRKMMAEAWERNAKNDDAIDDDTRFMLSWTKPEKTRQKEMRRYRFATEFDVSNGFDECASRLQAAIRNRGRKQVVVPKRLDPEGIKIRLPSHLKQVI